MSPPGPRHRPPVAGPNDGPEPPFPLKLSGPVIKGFGRGSKELGIPTANIPLSGLGVGGCSDLESGIYFGWAGLDFLSEGAEPAALTGNPHSDPASENDQFRKFGEEAVNKIGGVFGSQAAEIPQGWDGKGRVYPMVMSVGWNPFYKNTVRSVEVHIMHNFPRDFYGSHLNLLILGFIRPEYDYVSKESLIDDIKTDIQVAARSLARPAYANLRFDSYLLSCSEKSANTE